MTDYTKTTDFTSKDSLPSGDSGKIIRGAEFGTEFDNIQTAVNSKSNKENPSFTGNITVTGTVDGRDISADGTKLDTIETSADVTDTANVTAAGAVMDSELTDITAVKALNQGVATTDSPTFAAVTSTGNVTVGGTVDGRDVATDGTKLDTVETNADVTDTTNVTAAGALMDSEVTNLDQVKAFDSADYATAAQGTTADNALPKTGGAMTGAITTNSTFDGRDVATDGTKLDGIEALADVTDTTNVTAAGALMDSELTDIAAVKALNQGVATTDSPTFAGLTTTADVSFGDNDKAIFGAGSDLQLYHDGSNSYVEDTGDGALFLKTNGSGVFLYSGSEALATFNLNGASNLYYDNGLKLSTTSTGIDVTGTVTADGLTVDGTGTFTTADNIAQVTLISTDTDALVGPQLNLWRNSGTGTNGDLIGQITFTGEDTVGSTNTFASIYSVADQTNNGSEDGSIHFQTLINGVLADRLEINSAGNTVVTGTVTADGLALGDNEFFLAGAGGDLKIFHDGTDNIIRSQGPSLYIDANNHIFRGYAPYTEHMRIDSSGNVGIGSSSPDTLLHLSDTAGGAVIRLERNDTTIASTDVYGEIQFEGQDASAGSAAGIRGKILGVAEGVTGEMALAFQTAGGYGSSTERMRIDSSGNLLVGTTSIAITDEGFKVFSNGVVYGVVDNAQTNALWNKEGYTSGTTYFMDFRLDSVVKGSISSDGTSTSYNTSSDQRLKDNIVDAPSASDDIDAIQVRSFDWKADGSHQKYGMVAQELNTVAPEAVTEGETEEDMMGVDYSKLVPMLVKEIQSLRARVAQLETN